MTRFTLKKLIALTLACSLSCIAIGTGAQGIEDINRTGGYKVKFLLFSGRPNPTMTVTDKAQILKISETFASALTSENAAEASRGSAPADILGYNGVVIVAIAPKTRNLTQNPEVNGIEAVVPAWEEMHVNRGWIMGATKAEGGSVAVSAQTQNMPLGHDSSRKVEKLLVEIARTQGVIAPEIVDLIEQAVNDRDQ